MKLLVVILNYRITDLTIDCLRSLSSEIHRVPGTKVAVCENGTGEDAERRLREAIEANRWDDWVELTTIYPNRGFTGGNNVIIRAALASPDPPQYVLLLNADTLVHPHALEALVEFMDQKPQVGIAGSRLEGPDGRVQASRFRYQGIASELDRGLRLGLGSKLLSRWAVTPPTASSPCEADWVSGAGMIIRREVFDAIGLLDEGFFAYFEDMDFCLNAKRAGWPSWYVPESRVIHLEGAASGIGSESIKRRPKYWFKARHRFFLKNYGPIYTALADAAFIVGFSLWRLRRWIQRKPDTDPPHLLLDSIRGSVFLSGFKVKDVENPALRGSGKGRR
jgi:N-acetylglucosaminyl-diphospho-decaprenol L-rhamnosyltransferase